MIRATKAQEREALSFQIGSQVRIVGVAFPDVPHHARFIGKVGTVMKVLKTKREVLVLTDIGRRYAFPENLEALTHEPIRPI
jgi:hypothetical protein